MLTRLLRFVSFYGNFYEGGRGGLAGIGADLNNHGNPAGPIRLSEAVIGGSLGSFAGWRDFHNSAIHPKDAPCFTSNEKLNNLHLLISPMIMISSFKSRWRHWSRQMSWVNTFAKKVSIRDTFTTSTSYEDFRCVNLLRGDFHRSPTNKDLHIGRLVSLLWVTPCCIPMSLYFFLIIDPYSFAYIFS